MSPTSPASSPPLFFVINRGSGRQDTQHTCDLIENTVQAANRTYRIFAIDDIRRLQPTIDDAVAAAQREDGVVVAVGGDGTINSVAAAALARGCRFGIIPQGTFNYFGRTHAIPEDVEGALDELLHGRPTPVQVGLVNERLFLVNASVGLYPELLEDREAFKQRYGRSRLVALWSALVTAFGPRRHLDMVLEQGEEQVLLRTTTLFIGNNRLQLEQIGMPQAEALQQGELAAIAVKPVGTLALLGLCLRGALGKLADADNVTGFSFRKLTVAPLGFWRGARIPAGTGAAGSSGKLPRRRRIKIAADGEIHWMQGPLVFRVAPEPLLLVKRSPAQAEPALDSHGMGNDQAPRGEEGDG